MKAIPSYLCHALYGIYYFNYRIPKRYLRMRQLSDVTWIILDIALTEHPALKGWKVFLCGAPEMVQKISKLVFLSGANIEDISFDAFTYSSA